MFIPMKKSIFFVFTILLFSCTSMKDLPRVVPALTDLTTSDWVLKAMNEEEVEKEDFMKGLPALNFREGGVMDGMTGCNSFSGKFSLGDTFMLDPGAMTKMRCPGTGEADFLTAIQNTTALLMEGNDLLFVDGNEELLRFTTPQKK